MRVVAATPSLASWPIRHRLPKTSAVWARVLVAEKIPLELAIYMMALVGDTMSATNDQVLSGGTSPDWNPQVAPLLLFHVYPSCPAVGPTKPKPPATPLLRFTSKPLNKSKLPVGLTHMHIVTVLALRVPNGAVA